MFKKRTLILAFLCMLLLATACTAKSEDGQDKTEKTSATHAAVADVDEEVFRGHGRQLQYAVGGFLQIDMAT